jgi:hypothetical protein
MAERHAPRPRNSTKRVKFPIVADAGSIFMAKIMGGWGKELWGRFQSRTWRVPENALFIKLIMFLILWSRVSISFVVAMTFLRSGFLAVNDMKWRWRFGGNNSGETFSFLETVSSDRLLRHNQKKWKSQFKSPHALIWLTLNKHRLLLIVLKQLKILNAYAPRESESRIHMFSSAKRPCWANIGQILCTFTSLTLKIRSMTAS